MQYHTSGAHTEPLSPLTTRLTHVWTGHMENVSNLNKLRRGSGGGMYFGIGPYRGIEVGMSLVS